MSDRRVVALSGVSDRRRVVALGFERVSSFLPRRDGASRSSLRSCRPSRSALCPPPRCPRDSRRSRISSSWSKMECAASERCGESGRSYLLDPPAGCSNSPRPKGPPCRCELSSQSMALSGGDRDGSLKWIRPPPPPPPPPSELADRRTESDASRPPKEPP